MRNILSVSIAAALMVGCAPMKEATTAKVDASFVANKADTGATLPKWESFFSDPRLQSLIQQGLSNNRDVRLALARVSEARAQYGVTRADRFPSIDGVVSGTRSSQPADISPMGRRFDLTKGEVGISLPSYELDLWGRVANLTEAAQASYLASEANASAVQLALVGDIANAYYQWLETAEKLKISDDIYQNRLAIRGIIDKRMAVGLSTETERLQAEALNDGLLRDSAEISRQHKAAVNTLALLVGAPVSDASIGTGHALLQQADSSALHSHAPSSLLLRRPDVQAAELRLTAADANVEAARAAFLPRIALTASYGTASSSLTGLFSENSENWSFVPQITIPLFNVGRTQASYDLVAARQIQAVADYEKTIQTAFKEVADALLNRQNYAVQVKHQRDLLQHQRERLAISSKRYEQGMSNYMEVLDAQRETYSAEQTLLVLIRSQKAADVAVFKALGGGMS
jgi:multidrug efflux system outer membrane protein